MKKAFTLCKFLFVIGSLIFPTIVMAQVDFPDPFDDQVLDVPLDGGVSLLIAAGIGYGVKKVHDSKKAEKM